MYSEQTATPEAWVALTALSEVASPLEEVAPLPEQMGSPLGWHSFAAVVALPNSLEPMQV